MLGSFCFLSYDQHCISLIYLIEAPFQFWISLSWVLATNSLYSHLEEIFLVLYKSPSICLSLLIIICLIVSKFVFLFFRDATQYWITDVIALPRLSPLFASRWLSNCSPVHLKISLTKTALRIWFPNLEIYYILPQTLNSSVIPDRSCWQRKNSVYMYAYSKWIKMC